MQSRPSSLAFCQCPNTSTPNLKYMELNSKINLKILASQD